MKLRLYHYWRSSSSWRVRWALELKGVPCEMIAVSLLNDETDRPEYRAINPIGYVPVLEFLDQPEPSTPRAHAARFLTESAAMIEWIEETHPKNPLLPKNADERAHIRRLAEVINSGTQPFQNPPVFCAVSSDEEVRKKWCQHWSRQGLSTYENWIQGSSGRFSVGDQISLADLFLIPQCYAALRFELNLEKEFPTIAKVYANALATDACKAAHPDRYKPADA